MIPSRSPFAKTAAVVAALLFATGCATTLNVKPATSDERLPSPRFVISNGSGAEDAPRYDTLEVLDDAGTSVWKVRAQSFGDAPRPAEITYGQTPEGFEVVTPAVELTRGGRYHLFVSATGPKDGNLHFTIDADGRVQVPPR